MLGQTFLPLSQVLNSLQTDNLYFLLKPIWLSIIKGFFSLWSVVAISPTLFRTEDGQKKGKVLLIDSAAEMFPSFQEIHNGKPIKGHFINYFCSLLYAEALFRETHLCPIYSPRWHAFLAQHTMTN